MGNTLNKFDGNTLNLSKNIAKTFMGATFWLTFRSIVDFASCQVKGSTAQALQAKDGPAQHSGWRKKMHSSDSRPSTVYCTFNDVA